ncbi:hypothetical protein B0H14DRAFT_2615079 [Mycena olivaceomarginata]|nr:hypothetical protein B0H14DRAFT_2615079 [Mycena olivaceomarginata]
MEPLNLNPNTGNNWLQYSYEIGVLLSYVLFGVTTTQAYLYYTRFPEDSRKLKALVVFVWYSTTHGHHILFFPSVLFTFATGIPKNSTSGCMDTSGARISFFGYRKYVLSKKPYISYFSWTLAFLRCLAAIALGIAGILKDTLLHGYEVKWLWLINALWAVSITNDVVITTTLVYLLTIVLIDKLIVWTIETGMVTSCFPVLDDAGQPRLAGAVIHRNEMYHLFSVLDSLNSNDFQVFSNSLLASLNSRATIRAMNEISLFHSTPGSRTPKQMSTPRPLDVEMTTTKVSQIVQQIRRNLQHLRRFRPWISFSGNSSLGTAPDGETADFGSFISAEESGGI